MYIYIYICRERDIHIHICIAPHEVCEFAPGFARRHGASSSGSGALGFPGVAKLGTPALEGTKGGPKEWGS